MRTLTVAAILSLALPAQAHSEAELETWLDGWVAAGQMDWPLATADLPLFDLDAHQSAALADMVERHPCSRALDTWSEACERPVARPRLSPQAPAGTHRGGEDWRTSAEPWRPLLAAYFGSEVDRAVCVAGWESRGVASAVSPTNDYGLMQIHYPLWGPHFGVSKAQLLDPETNVRLAKAIRDSGGWGMWSAVTRGMC